jgi:trehalose-6-phosphate synthase
MRLSLRFIVPLLAVLALIAYAVVPLVDSLTFKWFVRDIDTRANLVATALHDTLGDIAEGNNRSRVQNLFRRIIQDERLYAIGLCDADLHLTYRTPAFPENVSCSPKVTAENSVTTILRLPRGPLHISFHGIQSPETGARTGQLVLVHDLSFVETRSADTKRYFVYFFVGMGLIISLITVLVAQLSWKGWMNGMRSILKGEGLLRPMSQISSPELRPIVKDLRSLVRDLEADRRTRDETQMTWSPKTLKGILRRELTGDEILIVSNREPYIHTRDDQGEIKIHFPASGLVTALEPIMRACSGTWIAHGSGNADRDVVDKNNRVAVPPGNPSYHIRRVWLTKEEEDGYYFGFANEGLWPLCHFAHTRPIFRSEDWQAYREVNQKFADAVVAEAKTDDPVVLVQDYHFALLPKMIKNKLPNATIITFWHIPWPNPEAFGICPWRDELLDGMLGSSILGFHTQFHCNNFIDTVDRYLESKIDRETLTISYGGHLTAVNNYPISIEWPARWLDNQKSVPECRRRIRELNHMPPDLKLGIGVDRLDYTKGILERFRAVERFLETSPEWIGRYSFIQIAAPSRATIAQYKQFGEDVLALAARINERFGRDGYRPIHLKMEHHTPDQVFEYFRASELCFVSSLHDGMNLVAKEYIAARDDEEGVLILSQFTGASRELAESLIVNPYNIDQCASAMKVALEMPLVEQRNRMRSMRGLIQEFNVYRWAGRMLMDAARIRQRTRFQGRFGDNSNSAPFSFQL